MEHERTEKLFNEIRESQDVYSYISKYDTDFPTISLPDFIDLIIQKKELKKSHVVKKADLNRTYAYQIMSGQKKASRSKMIRLAYGLNLNLEETQKLLKISEFNPLSPKNKRDAIIIFAICNEHDIDRINDVLFENNEESI